MAAEPPNCGDHEGINIMQDNKKITQDKTYTPPRAGRAARTPAALTGLFLAGFSLAGLSIAGFAQADGDGRDEVLREAEKEAGEGEERGEAGEREAGAGGVLPGVDEEAV